MSKAGTIVFCLLEDFTPERLSVLDWDSVRAKAISIVQRLGASMLHNLTLEDVAQWAYGNAWRDQYRNQIDPTVRDISDAWLSSEALQLVTPTPEVLQQIMAVLPQEEEEHLPNA